MYMSPVHKSVFTLILKEFLTSLCNGRPAWRSGVLCEHSQLYLSLCLLTTCVLSLLMLLAFLILSRACQQACPTLHFRFPSGLCSPAHRIHPSSRETTPAFESALAITGPTHHSLQKRGSGTCLCCHRLADTPMAAGSATCLPEFSLCLVSISLFPFVLRHIAEARHCG